MKRILLYSIFCGLLFACGNDDTLDTLPNSDTDPIVEEPLDEESTTENLLLQLQGTQLVDSNQNPVYLQGVAFNNYIWNNDPLPPDNHHSELDYERVSAMGMNTIRFYMNYRVFEDDANPYTYKQSGWDWLDQNIAWAKNHGIYLVLNMHAPQGGYQSQGAGDALWDDIENQNRLSALWQAIAARYKNEGQIAGYGPVNEPLPSQSIDQWSSLAQRLINDIREVDTNHILFIEQAIQVKGQAETANFNFPDVNGTGIIYEFHGYDPYFYTHQLLEFARLGEGGTYPDEDIVETSGSEWYTTMFNNPTLIPNTTDWTFYQGERFLVNDTNIKIAVPLVASGNVGGTVYFDDMVIKEYDENGNFVRDLPNINLNDAAGWFYWSENNTGTGGLSSEEGRTDTNSLFVSGATANSNLGNFNRSFIPKQNYSYEVNGWMKGVDAAANNRAALRLDFYTLEGEVSVRNKAYLETEIGQIIVWAQNKNAALYMGEFGAGYPCFQDNKGGLQFVEDMTDILTRNDIHFTYHSYHEDSFGLYLGFDLPDPNNVNQPLIDWFTDNLK